MLMDKLFKRIVDVIFVLAIILLSLYFILRIIGIIEISEVETGSMEDGIHAGDYVLIYKKNVYNVGDVITFKKDGYYVTHRIVKKQKKGIVTKGDANNTEDDAIKVSSIVGKVILVGGILNVLITFKYGIASFLLALYLLTYYFYKEKEDKEASENKIDSEGKKETKVNKEKEKKIVRKVSTSRKQEILSRKRLKKRIKVKYRKNK